MINRSYLKDILYPQFKKNMCFLFIISLQIKEINVLFLLALLLSHPFHFPLSLNPV